VYIVCFNNHYYVENMVRQLLRIGVVPRDVVVIDNASDAPTQRWLTDVAERALGVVVRRQTRNCGHMVLYEPHVWAELPPLFAYSDPDLQFSPSMPRDFLRTLADIAAACGVYKAGLALSLDGVYGAHTVPDYAYGQSIAEWEARYWVRRAPPLPPPLDGHAVYAAHVDTTFAVYRKESRVGGTHITSAVRVAGAAFTCMHLPWHPDENARVPLHELEYMYEGRNSNTGQHVLHLERVRRGVAGASAAARMAQLSAADAAHARPLPHLRPVILAHDASASAYQAFFESPWADGAARAVPIYVNEGALLLDGRDVVLMEHGDLVGTDALRGARSVTLLNTGDAAHPAVRERVLAQWEALSAALGPERVTLADFSRANLRAWLPSMPPHGTLALRPVVARDARVDALRGLLATAPKEFDVGFVGAMTPRRLAILRCLAERGLRVNRVDAWGNVRDALLARCRVLVNIHQSDGHAVFEAPRCAAWLAAGLPLVTEAGLRGCTDDDPPPSADVAVVPYDELVDAATALAVRHGAERGSTGTLLLSSTDMDKFRDEAVPGFTC